MRRLGDVISRRVARPLGWYMPRGVPPFDFNLGEITFTPNMAKRVAAGPFATGPIVQGDANNLSGLTDDVLTYPRGAQLANPLDEFYGNWDGHQGSVVLWWTPEFSSADLTGGDDHYLWRGDASPSYLLRYEYDNNRFVFLGGNPAAIRPQAIVAGTTYCIVCRWAQNPLDGTNYACITVDEVHTFGGTTQPTPGSDSPNYIGNQQSQTDATSGIIEGLTVYRRPLWDGTYGIDVGNGDEMAAIYAAGAGADPCRTTGSWDGVLGVPTDSTPGVIATGPGNAWSHPHGSAELDVGFMSDGYGPNQPYVVGLDGTSTRVDCGSGATLDDIPDGGTITVEAWVKLESTAVGLRIIAMKGSQGNTRGWYLGINSSDEAVFYVYLAGTDAEATSTRTIRDGKWHHIVGYYDDATKTARTAVDGNWGAADVGVGAYQVDAADSLVFGRRVDAASQYWGPGAIGWPRISDNDRFTAGTDFISPRTQPAADGNTVEQWDFDEGTGANAAADVTSPANDGTITSGSWSAIWQDEGTLVVPQSLEIDGIITSLTNVTDAATIRDLPAGDFTADIEFRAAGRGASNSGELLDKATGETNGWQLRINAAVVRAFVALGTTNAAVIFARGLILDNVWHSIRLRWIFATRTLSLYLDGVLQDTDTGAGAYQTDNGVDLKIGTGWDGAIGRVVLSDVDRGGGNAFVSEGRPNPPAVDGNTQLQINMTDGAGTTATDTSGNANHGTITMGTGRWLNTGDMGADEPGARTFEWGKNVGSDGAQDGLTIIKVGVTENTDYVLRLVASYGQSGRAWPDIYIYDNSNAAQIGATFDLPRITDIHTGGNGSATLINANGSFTQQLVGWTVYNITDGSSATITAVSGDKTTITGVLAGGTDDDWDTNDVYILRPPNNGNYCVHPSATETIFVFRTPAGCTSIDVKLRNGAGEGVMQLHQCEVQESLLDNGDHEAMAGNPAILTGWTNANLDAGDTEAEAAVIHAGAQSMEWNVGAQNENQFHPAVSSQGRYVAAGIWVYGDGTAQVQLRTSSTASGVRQDDPTQRSIPTGILAAWAHHAGIYRVTGAGVVIQLFAVNTLAAGDRWTDDVYAIECDDVTLTVTPASEANSLESGGIRIDGFDTGTQPIAVGDIGATRGLVRFDFYLRHASAIHDEFGNATPILATWWGNVTNYIQLHTTGANGDLVLTFNDGGGAHTVTWAAPGLLVDTRYRLEVEWWGSMMVFRVYVPGTAPIVRGTNNQPVAFATVPTIAYYGSRQAGDWQSDVVFLAP